MVPEKSPGDKESTFTDRVRDALLQVAPEYRDLITARDVVVKVFCADNGIRNINYITIDQTMEIQNYPNGRTRSVLYKG